MTTQLVNGGARGEPNKIFSICPSRSTIHLSLSLVALWTACLGSLTLDVANGRQRQEPGVRGERNGGICPQFPPAVLWFASG